MLSLGKYGLASWYSARFRASISSTMGSVSMEKPLRSSRTFTSADIRRRTSSSCLLAVMSPTVASQSSLLW